jgi:hypothetical protein
MITIQKWFAKWLLLTLLWFVLNSIDLSQLQLADARNDVLVEKVLVTFLESLILCWILANSSKDVALPWLRFSLPLLMQLRSKFSTMMDKYLVFREFVVVVFARKSRGPVVSPVRP